MVNKIFEWNEKYLIINVKFALNCDQMGFELVIYGYNGFEKHPYPDAVAIKQAE